MTTIADIPAEVRRNFQAARLKARRTGRPFPWTLQTWVSAAEGGVSGPRVMAPVAVRTVAEAGAPKYGTEKRRKVALKIWKKEKALGIVRNIRRGGDAPHARPVQTPFGRYETIAQASEAAGVHKSTGMRWAREGKEGWFFLDEE